MTKIAFCNLSIPGVQLIKDFHKLTTRFRQFGGMRLLRQYAEIGVLWTGVNALFAALIKKHTFKKAYSELLKKVEPFLAERYREVLKERKLFYERQECVHSASNVIWFCWLQGLENAPLIVKACYNSLKRNLSNREIKVIDADNWRKYVDLPQFIVEKWERRRIPAANFSDLLRLQLLIKYGGAWIDSTVLCTCSSNVNEFLDADLFLFRYSKQGNLPLSISNWFISSCSNNEVLLVLRDMLLAYWRDYDCVLDYYIFHLFFAMLSKEYPEQMLAMPNANSRDSLVLLNHWNEQFDKGKWDMLTAKVPFHKLSARPDRMTISNSGNYYNAILRIYS